MTAQGIPEGVQPPVVTPLSYSSLHVSWSEPNRPNGIIQRYHLNQTGVGTIVTHTDGSRRYNVSGRTHVSFTVPFPNCTISICFWFPLLLFPSVPDSHRDTLYGEYTDPALECKAGAQREVLSQCCTSALRRGGVWTG